MMRLLEVLLLRQFVRRNDYDAYLLGVEELDWCTSNDQHGTTQHNEADMRT